MMTRAFSLYLVISGSSLEGLILRRNGSTFVNNSGDDSNDDNDSNDDDNDDDNDHDNGNDDDNDNDNDNNDDDNDNDDNYKYYYLVECLNK